MSAQQQLPSLHYPGYEGECEEIVTVREIHRAECEQCGWVSEEFDEMGWKDAEQAAVEHFEECPEIWDDTEECDCPTGPEPRSPFVACHWIGQELENRADLAGYEEAWIA